MVIRIVAYNAISDQRMVNIELQQQLEAQEIKKLTESILEGVRRGEAKAKAERGKNV